MENPYTERTNSPSVKSTVDKEEFLIFLLAKAGWYGGNPSAIIAAPVDEVMKAYHFEIMTRQYKNTLFEMSKSQK